MTGDLQTHAHRTLGLVEKTILGFIAGAAAAIGVVETVFLVQRIVGLVADETTTLPGVPLLGPLPADLGAAPALVSAEYDTVTLVVDGLPAGARAALVAAAVLGSLLTVGICAVVAWLCLRVFVGRPFVRSATWGIGIVSILIVLVTLARPTLLGVAHAEAAALTGLDALPDFLVAFDPTPLGWAFALAVVGGAFELGQRFQRDSEALI